MGGRSTAPAAVAATSRIDIPESDLASELLKKLKTDETLMVACRRSGMLPEDLEPVTDLEYFQDKEVLSDGSRRSCVTSEEIIKLRMEHWATRRHELAEELQAAWKKQADENAKKEAKRQQSQLDGGPSVTVTLPSTGTADPSSLLARDVRKMEQLTRRRQEEIAKMLDFQMKQREMEQVSCIRLLHVPFHLRLLHELLLFQRRLLHVVFHRRLVH